MSNVPLSSPIETDTSAEVWKMQRPNIRRMKGPAQCSRRPDRSAASNRENQRPFAISRSFLCECRRWRHWPLLRQSNSQDLRCSMLVADSHRTDWHRVVADRVTRCAHFSQLIPYFCSFWMKAVLVRSIRSSSVYCLRRRHSNLVPFHHPTQWLFSPRFRRSYAKLRLHWGWKKN